MYSGSLIINPSFNVAALLGKEVYGEECLEEESSLFLFSRDNGGTDENGWASIASVINDIVKL